MRHFENFETVVYIPAQVAASFTKAKLSREYSFLEKYVGLDKVYLETHRGECDVDKEKLLMIKGFLESKGVKVSGGITTTIPDFKGAEPGKSRLFETFCYTDPAMRNRLKEIVEFTAGIFDELILDDFYFTNCTCERCVKEKGNDDWVTFRKKLMLDVSKNIIVDPAKKVNPKINVIIKYPNWRESYHAAGYVPNEQSKIFDATYTGTETRSPMYTDQHLPEYLSYSLVRYMENAWPNRNGGGWLDTYQCWSADRYLEQAYLTAFSKAKEIMLFQWSDLIDNYFVSPMGLQLNKIDKMLKGTGAPKGVHTYIPFESGNQNHVEMRLGMLGLNIESSPSFNEKAKSVLLTEDAAKDKDIVKKLKEYVRRGGKAVITTGFFLLKGDELRKEGLTQATLEAGDFTVTRYQVTGDEGGYYEHKKPILFPILSHFNNDSWSLLNGGDKDVHHSLFLRSSFEKGNLYIFAVPKNPSDLYEMPAEAIDVVKRALFDETYVTGKHFSFFEYEDGSFIMYRYVKKDLHTDYVTVHTDKKVKALRNLTTGKKIEVTKEVVSEDFKSHEFYSAKVLLTPGVFEKFAWE
jgi:hypothetical protein